MMLASVYCCSMVKTATLCRWMHGLHLLLSPQGPSPAVLEAVLCTLAVLATANGCSDQPLPPEEGPPTFEAAATASSSPMGTAAGWLVAQPLAPLVTLLSHAAPRVQARALRLLRLRVAAGGAAAACEAASPEAEVVGPAVALVARGPCPVQLAALRLLRQLVVVDGALGSTGGQGAAAAAAAQRAGLAEALGLLLLQPPMANAAAPASSGPKAARGAPATGPPEAGAPPGGELIENSAVEAEGARLLGALARVSPAAAAQFISARGIEALAALLPDPPQDQQAARSNNDPATLAGAAAALGQGCSDSAGPGSRPQTVSSRPPTGGANGGSVASRQATSEPSTMAALGLAAAGCGATAASPPVDRHASGAGALRVSAAAPPAWAPPDGASRPLPMPAHKARSDEVLAEVLAALSALLAHREAAACTMSEPCQPRQQAKPCLAAAPPPGEAGETGPTCCGGAVMTTALEGRLHAPFALGFAQQLLALVGPVQPARAATTDQLAMEQGPAGALPAHSGDKKSGSGSARKAPAVASDEAGRKAAMEVAGSKMPGSQVCRRGHVTVCGRSTCMAPWWILHAWCQQVHVHAAACLTLMLWHHAHPIQQAAWRQPQHATEDVVTQQLPSTSAVPLQIQAGALSCLEGLCGIEGFWPGAASGGLWPQLQRLVADVAATASQLPAAMQQQGAEAPGAAASGNGTSRNTSAAGVFLHAAASLLGAAGARSTPQQAAELGLADALKSLAAASARLLPMHGQNAADGGLGDTGVGVEATNARLVQADVARALMTLPASAFAAPLRPPPPSPPPTPPPPPLPTSLFSWDLLGRPAGVVDVWPALAPRTTF
jgi:hypothetical protein